MPLPPLTQCLDPRTAEEAEAMPITGAVNIPLAELRTRTHELPPPGAPLFVVGPADLAEETIGWLAKGGRFAETLADWGYGVAAPGRLWSPNEFLQACLPGLRPGNAVDLGCGTGRDAVALAAGGFRVLAIDHLPDALERGADLARRYAPESDIEWRRLDLERETVPWPEPLDLVVMFFHLNRMLLTQAEQRLAPGGSILVETFTTLHRERHGKPSADLALQPGELAMLLSGLEVRQLDEGWREGRHTARIWAVRA